ncbi:MAG: hypothetical protein ACRC0Y_05505, partial [Fusobacteriaceae bacterium]
MFIKLLLVLLFIFSIAYSFHKIYNNYFISFSVPFFIILPFLLFYFFRNTRDKNLEIFLGHYLFYLNYILLISFILLIFGFILNLFSIDIYSRIVSFKFHFHFSILFLLIGLTFLGDKNFNNIVINTFESPLSNKYKVNNLKLGFISDIHLNGKFDGNKLRRAFKKMENENVEIVLIGGDFLDNT